jgi:hypothetical protein
VISVTYRDKEGKEHRDQLEGHLQYMRPDRLALSFDKVGNTVAWLGGNEQKYWWIETREDPRAYVGEHAKATPERIQELGLPVHPLNFIELLGITALPESAQGTKVAWSKDGRSLIVRGPGRLGDRRLWLDPDRMTPQRIELLDRQGGPALAADLSSYDFLNVRNPRADWSPTVATRLEATQERDGLRVVVILYDPETAGGRPKPGVFDLDTILQSLGIRKVVDLDAPGAPLPSVPPGGAGQ